MDVTQTELSEEQKLEYLKQRIGSYPDFPKAGILFRDLFSALTDGQACRYLKDLLVGYVRRQHPQVDVIVGLESRGFLLNLLIAAELGVACAPVRKQGKLPGLCYAVSYEYEYATNVFELQVEAIKPGQKVIIVDDLLATGGSLNAAIDLVRKAGGVVLASIVVIELQALQGRPKVNSELHSLLQL